MRNFWDCFRGHFWPWKLRSRTWKSFKTLIKCEGFFVQWSLISFFEVQWTLFMNLNGQKCWNIESWNIFIRTWSIHKKYILKSKSFCDHTEFENHLSKIHDSFSNTSRFKIFRTLGKDDTKSRTILNSILLFLSGSLGF